MATRELVQQLLQEAYQASAAAKSQHAAALQRLQAIETAMSSPVKSAPGFASDLFDRTAMDSARSSPLSKRSVESPYGAKTSRPAAEAGEEAERESAAAEHTVVVSARALVSARQGPTVLAYEDQTVATAVTAAKEEAATAVAALAAAKQEQSTALAAAREEAATAVAAAKEEAATAVAVLAAARQEQSTALAAAREEAATAVAAAKEEAATAVAALAAARQEQSAARAAARVEAATAVAAAKEEAATTVAAAKEEAVTAMAAQSAARVAAGEAKAAEKVVDEVALLGMEQERASLGSQLQAAHEEVKSLRDENSKMAAADAQMQSMLMAADSLQLVESRERSKLEVLNRKLGDELRQKERSDWVGYTYLLYVLIHFR